MNDNPRIREIVGYEPGKLPPQAVDIEEVLIGALLIDAKAFVNISGILHEDYFYKESHKLIYRACHQLFTKGEPIDLGTVRNQLTKSKDIEFVGGPFYLSNLTDHVGSSANIVSYARIIQEKWVLREQIKIGSQVMQSAYEPDTDPFELFDKINAMNIETLDRVKKGSERSAHDIAVERVKMYERRKNGEVGTGVQTFFEPLDTQITCFENGECIVFAGRPGMGKTTQVLQICVENALRGLPVAFLSAEMTPESVIDKIVFYLAGVATYKMRKTNHLTPSEITKLGEAAEKLRKTPIYVESVSGATINEVRSTWYRLMNKYGIKLFAFDYIQRANYEGRSDDETLKVTQFIRGWNNLCKATKIPGIAISQLNRDVERRSDKKPMLSDLRQSGAIEEEADMVIFNYRPEYYGLEVDVNGFSVKGQMKNIIAKFRGGEVQDVVLGWDGPYTRVLSEWNPEDGEDGKSFESDDDNPF